VDDEQLRRLRATRARVSEEHRAAPAERPVSTARGVHHVALICRDVEETVRFYQGVLGWPVTELMENRDYAGSTHFFFDVGNGNTLAFFDFPGLGLGEYVESLGSLQHVCVAVEREQWERLRQRLVDHGVDIHEESGTSVYFRGPSGEGMEIISDPLGEMYGDPVL
jgi:catechol 2,3-dioxygenase-like lactoylglutathione lyase family enzyme